MAIDALAAGRVGANSNGEGLSLLAAVSMDDRSSGASSLDGTRKIPPHALHLARFPAMASATLNCLPQNSQLNSMLIEFIPPVTCTSAIR
ncbi:MAG TPA: hypothetical protein VFE47_32150 [Tepidisphaeraceae bacterium]|nr:hypothetical protein [Tepidisphaeraceae bacterium]